MLKKIGMSLAAITLIGCGGGSGNSSTSSLAKINNSTVGALENQYGYFGDNVKFGNDEIVGFWTLVNESLNDTIVLSFRSDGEFVDPTQSGFTYDYGVSKDGLTLVSSIFTDLTITSLRKDYVEIENINSERISIDCYELNNRPELVICPAWL